MDSPENNVKKGEDLIAQARQRDKCGEQAANAQDAIDNLRDEARFTLGEKLSIVAIGGGAILTALITGGLGAIVSIGAAGVRDSRCPRQSH